MEGLWTGQPSMLIKDNKQVIYMTHGIKNDIYVWVFRVETTDSSIGVYRFSAFSGEESYKNQVLVDPVCGEGFPSINWVTGLIQFRTKVLETEKRNLHGNSVELDTQFLKLSMGRIKRLH